MLPVGVQRRAAGSYSSAPAVYAPPATSTRPSRRRTATCSERGWLSVPPAIHVPVDESYSSVVDSPTPPTTRTRPFSSGVAVTPARGIAMSAVAVQLPAAVGADEASGTAATASSAQMADAAAFVLTMSPLHALPKRRA
jgi:hypothetical protein